MPDEGAHYLKAYEVSHLHFFNTAKNSGIDIPCDEYLVAAIKHHRIAMIQDKATDEISDPNCKVNSANTAGTYSFVPYIPSAIALAITENFQWEVENRLKAARFSNFVVWFSIIFFSLLLVQQGQQLIACIVLMPSFLWQTVALSADGATFAFCFFYFLLILSWAQKRLDVTPKMLGVLVAVGGLIGASKGVYAPLALVSFALWDQVRISSVARKVLILLSPTLLALAVFISITSVANKELIFLGHSANPAEQINYILTHPLRVIGYVFNAILSMDYVGLVASGFTVGNSGRRTGITVAFGLAVLILLLRFDFGVSRRFRQVAGLTFIALLFSIALPLYLTYTPVGYRDGILGIQSRYYLPALPLQNAALAFNAAEVDWKKVWGKVHWIVLLPALGLLVAVVKMS